jgi:hypothetical protein
MSKYEPLSDWLRGQKGTALDLNFRQIESVLRFALPKSARTYREWWANSRSGHVQSRGWMDANWQVDAVELERQRVKFVKRTSDSYAEVLRELSPHDLNSNVAERVDYTQTSSITDADFFKMLNLSDRAQKWLDGMDWNDQGPLKRFEAWLEQQASIASRRAVIEKYANLNEPLGSDSTLLIREDRDAR